MGLVPANIGEVCQEQGWVRFPGPDFELGAFEVRMVQVNLSTL